MSNERERERLRSEINRRMNKLEDEQLIELAWSEFDAWKAKTKTKEVYREQLQEAQRQLNEEVVISREGRQRVRRFIATRYINKRLGKR
jgi:hypothetical protein